MTAGAKENAGAFPHQRTGSSAALLKRMSASLVNCMDDLSCRWTREQISINRCRHHRLREVNIIPITTLFDRLHPAGPRAPSARVGRVVVLFGCHITLALAVITLGSLLCRRWLPRWESVSK
jgi:hypothetical protein